ncbi:hypothetical protein [Devosia sp.]|jgi:DNA-binding CsgD family transcriptional regulator|uniref:hypothetical protein n=1 Tax=Devosia sp. TaxID=1871048 RepID=UPI003BADA439
MAMLQREPEVQDWVGFDNPYRLTPRELELCLLLRDAVPHYHMSAMLHLSPVLIAATLGRVMRKTGARNSAHLQHIIATLHRSPVEPVFIEDISERFEAAPLDPYAYQSVVFA